MHRARLQVGLELQEELVPRDLLPQLARIARVEFDPKVKLMNAASCKKSHPLKENFRNVVFEGR